MTITEKSWAEYINRLARLNETAGRKMAEYIEQHGTADAGSLVAYANALVQKYGEGSAELACQMYDALAEASGAGVPPAEPAAVAGVGEVAKMVNGTLASPPLLQGGVSRMVKQAGADTTLQNALRDGAEFAWVPHGDTCAFCITLASRGWQKAGKAAIQNGHAAHIHANCDCEYAVRFNRSTSVAGYDPAEYLRQYEAAGGDTNALRRARYAANRDAINAQKRAAYAARKRLPGSYSDLQLQNYAVTMESISGVKVFRCETLDTAGQRALQDAHKRLLAEVAKQPLGTEMARCYGLDMRPLGGYSTGKEGQGKVKIPDFDVPYIAVHNHPSGLTFSPGDMLGFANRSNMRMLTAAGNDGMVYAVEKTAAFSAAEVRDLFVEAYKRLHSLESPAEAVGLMQKYLEEAAEYGVTYYSSAD